MLTIAPAASCGPLSSDFSSSSSSAVLQPLDFAADFAGEGFVPFGQLQHAGQIGARADDFVQRLENASQRLQFADRLASPLLIVQKSGAAMRFSISAACFSLPS